jgi:hypothetical protein
MLSCCKKALTAKITLALGYEFSAANQNTNFIHFNAAEFTYVADRSMEKLGHLIEDMISGGEVGFVRK